VLPYSPSGVYSLDCLRRSGLSEYTVRKLLANADLRRLRYGWYAAADADHDAARAVQTGGVLTGPRRLALLGGWLPESSPLEVLLVPGARIHRSVSGRARFRYRPRIQHRELPYGLAPPLTALQHSIETLGLAEAVAVADSLLHAAVQNAMPHREALSEHQIVAEMLRTSQGARVAARCDAAAESGLESIARVRFQEAGLRVDSQVELPNRQRIDLVVERRVGVELDGSTHMSQITFHGDRAKDALAARRGLIPLRFTYHQVTREWEQVLETVLRALATSARH
jgi:very-short-patch-repair endonuclease